MAIFELTKNEISGLRETTFSEIGIREREDLQRLLREKIEIISPDILIISEEFCDWNDSTRRIDLLGIKTVRGWRPYGTASDTICCNGVNHDT